jgi:microcompartment protein CcmK/EutM
MAGHPPKRHFNFSAARLSDKSAPEPDMYALQALLSRYGYLLGAYTPGQYDGPTRDAVIKFQSYYRIEPEEDGVCDEPTLRLLSQPRCGVADKPEQARSPSGRLAPYVVVGATWPMANLTYKFLNATLDIAQDRQRAIVREAFSRWAGVCALTFSEAQGNVQHILSVGFFRGSHGDGNPFDDQGGPDGNTLAHAFFPPPNGGPWAGALHFDEFELWKDPAGGTGTRLYNVALHEIGHLLGLAHSQDQNAIMYAYYGEDRNDLRPDDIAGVQSLYGAPTTGPSALAPGQPVTGQLPQTNAEARYQLTFSNKLIIRLDGPAGQDFDLYVKAGDQVGRGQGEYDYFSYGSTADETITIDNPKSGKYSILVHSYSGSGNYTLEVDTA